MPILNAVIYGTRDFGLVSVMCMITTRITGSTANLSGQMVMKTGLLVRRLNINFTVVDYRSYIYNFVSINCTF